MHVEYNLATKTQMAGYMLRESLIVKNYWKKMEGKALRGRKRLHMLSNLASSATYLEINRSADDREGRTAINITYCYTADHYEEKNWRYTDTQLSNI